MMKLIGVQVKGYLVSGEGLGGQVCWVQIQGDHTVQGSHMTPQPDVLQTTCVRNFIELNII